MQTVIVSLESLSQYGQSKKVSLPKLDKELHNDYETRTWRERCHADKDGNIFIPPMALKNCLSECAKYLGIQIPGKGKNNYTKHFEAGIMCLEPLFIGAKKDTIDGLWLFVPSDGKRGGGKRVDKCFPYVTGWKGDVTYHVLDDTITRSAFELHVEEAGKFIGMGFFRPRNNGYWGRFRPTKFAWQ